MLTMFKKLVGAAVAASPVVTIVQDSQKQKSENQTKVTNDWTLTSFSPVPVRGSRPEAGPAKDNTSPADDIRHYPSTV